MPDGFLDPFWYSCKVVAESSFLPAQVTAMVRLGAVVVRAATTGLLRSALPAMLGAWASTVVASIRRPTAIGTRGALFGRFSNIVLPKQNRTKQNQFIRECAARPLTMRPQSTLPRWKGKRKLLKQENNDNSRNS